MPNSTQEFLVKLAAGRGELGRQLPPLQHYEKFKKTIYQGKNLTIKEKALIALAIAVVKQCKYCITVHLKEAIEAGANDGEIFEACGVAILMGGGPALGYTTFVQEALADLRNISQEANV